MFNRLFKRYFYLIPFCLATLLLLGVVVGPVLADNHSGPKQRGSLERAVEQVKRNSNGKILSANTVRDGKRAVHNIRVLTKQGRVKRVRIDARSGRLLNPR